MNIVRLRRYFLYLFAFSINFESFDFSGAGYLSVSKIFGYLYFITLIIGPTIFKKHNFGLLWMVVYFFVYLILINLLNLSTFEFYSLELPLLQNIILFFLLIYHEKHDIYVLNKALLFFSIGAFILSVFYMYDIGVSVSDDLRVSIFGENENTVGLKMTIALIIILILVFQNPLNFGKIRFLLLAFMPPMLSLMVNTGSRVALISFFLTAALISVMIPARNLFARIMIFSLSLLFGIYLWQMILEIEMIQMRIELMKSGDTANREDIWKSALYLFEENFLFGVGKTGFNEYYFNKNGQISSPHNVFIEVLVYTGLIGFTFFIIWLLKITRISIDIYLKTKHMMPLLILIPIFCVMITGQILHFKIFWMLFAFSASYNMQLIVLSKNI